MGENEEGTQSGDGGEQGGNAGAGGDTTVENAENVEVDQGGGNAEKGDDDA